MKTSTLANMIDHQTKLFTSEDSPTCEYCGRKLKRNTFFNTYRGRFQSFGWIECDCEGAKQARAAKEKAQQSELAQERERKRKRMLQKAGIGLRYIDAYTPNCEELADKILTEKCNLFITGNVGSGKTYLASAILRELVLKTTCRFTYFNTLINDLMRYHDETAGDLMSACKGCGVLAIDDMGKENISDFVVSQIFELVNERNANMRPIIITSNYTVNELGKRIASKGNAETAKAIISRLTDDCKILTLQHEDRRKNSN